MKKRILSLTLVMLMCLSVFSISAAAADAAAVSASYASGVVTFTGTGFASGASYTVRVVDTTDSSIIAMMQVTAAADGSISASITTGTLSSSLNYALYSNKADGTLAASDVTITVPASSTGGSGGTSSGGSGTGTGTVTPDVSKFTDVSSGSWYYTVVKHAVETGLMDGTSETIFEPDSSMTRAMFATVLYRLAGSPTVTGTSGFTDVVSGTWYDSATTWGESNSIIKGMGNNEFSPNTAVTREQMATLMCRYASFLGRSVITADTSIGNYSDSISVSAWAYSAMSWSVANGLINGMGNNTLAPQSSATRAQVAAILMRFENMTA
jgi:hypothetical protein